MVTERIEALECIGCGRIEGLQTCIGVCQDRKTAFVHAADYDAALARAEALLGLIRQLAWTTPRAGEWEHSFRILQDQARRVLAASADESPATP